MLGFVEIPDCLPFAQAIDNITEPNNNSSVIFVIFSVFVSVGLAMKLNYIHDLEGTSFWLIKHQELMDNNIGS